MTKSCLGNKITIFQLVCVVKERGTGSSLKRSSLVCQGQDNRESQPPLSFKSPLRKSSLKPEGSWPSCECSEGPIVLPSLNWVPWEPEKPGSLEFRLSSICHFCPYCFTSQPSSSTYITSIAFKSFLCLFLDFPNAGLKTPRGNTLSSYFNSNF